MDFSLNEYQSTWKLKASQFADKELRPLRRVSNLNSSAITEVYKKATAYGLFEICLKDRNINKPSDLLTVVLVTEELSKGSCSFASMFVNHYLASRVAQISNDQGFQHEILERIANVASGTEIAFLWPRVSASKSAKAYTQEEIAKPDEVVTSIYEFLAYASSDVKYFIGCSMSNQQNPLYEFQLILVERGRIKVLKEYQDTLSSDSLRLYNLQLGDLSEIKKSGVRHCDHSDKLINDLLIERVILFSAIAIGVAGAAFDYAHTYSGKRITFGRPILQHQAISLKLADMYMNLAAARLLLWESSRMHGIEGEAESIQDVLAYWNNVGFDIASSAMRILGGHGYLDDHPVGKWVREIQFLCLI